MTKNYRLYLTVIPAAFGSVLSMAAQALLAVFLLRLYTPSAVGEFSLVTQVAFGWATLALAQSSVSILANQHESAKTATIKALHISFYRWLWIAPFAILILSWSLQEKMHHKNSLNEVINFIIWTILIAIFQMGWILSQSLALRMHSNFSIAAVRAIPPLLAVCLVGFFAIFTQESTSNVLFISALLGYTIGCVWLFPLFTSKRIYDENQVPANTSYDERTELMKLGHTLSDVIAATLLAIQWSALYGTSETGYLLLLLRIFGFVPAIINSAWSQVVLSRPNSHSTISYLPALIAIFILISMALFLNIGLNYNIIPSKWMGLKNYLIPLLIWQISASLIAAFSYRPFLTGSSRKISQQCILINTVQCFLLILPSIYPMPIETHLNILSYGLTFMLCTQTWWIIKTPRQTKNI